MACRAPPRCPRLGSQLSRRAGRVATGGWHRVGVWRDSGKETSGAALPLLAVREQAGVVPVVEHVPAADEVDDPFGLLPPGVEVSRRRRRKTTPPRPKPTVHAISSVRLGGKHQVARRLARTWHRNLDGMRSSARVLLPCKAKRPAEANGKQEFVAPRGSRIRESA
jgi:hypothetical protein